ncbi:peptidyl-tRNA hydrolase [Magnetospirillum gryphiswaldense MSR-1 v2]|uniref:Peptidyl-tRNA hydrolase n=1 Tax=Magnetospirillum gryphiswaldense (strain DSM 6361 / JCM 21280 / NBRC 15271 / MSR-1) TaxID=431944 RepID=V6F3J7_MAGGM|nr:aminoacyl-tRNA hydrolase [Magnetospirillum gryphiswaldense]CDK99967.1 peptidyl-tRNA hydrolase [Magnetospirillum gryphiswaldense MSR-1 v2]
MILVVGLGNPGSEYSQNRHNIGFMAADELVRRHSFGPWRAKFQGMLAEGNIDGVKVLALKPMTYMNLSGQSVAAAARFLKIPVEDVVVVHDELDVAPGRVKVKRGGGAGGHNGLKSIDAHLGQNYRRVRLGIGHPGDKDRVSGYVLADFAKAETWVTPLIDAVAEALPKLLAGDEAGFMNKVAVLTAPPKPKKDKPAPQAPIVPSMISPPAPVSPQGSLAEALKAALERKKD